MADPYINPQTGILRNIPNFENKEVLREYEYEQTDARIRELRNEPVKGNFNLDHLKKIHGYVFQDVYDWAGEIRTVSLEKGGNLFALPQYIEPEANRLSHLLAKENHLQGLDKPQFIERLAHHHGELNALHPFREGNGRAMQVFVTELSQKAGYELNFEQIDKKQWNMASMHSYNGNLEPMKRILETAIKPLELEKTNGAPGQTVVDDLQKKISETFEKVDWNQAKPDHPSQAPKLDTELYRDLHKLSCLDFEKAAKLWDEKVPSGCAKPTFVDRNWHLQNERLRQVTAQTNDIQKTAVKQKEQGGGMEIDEDVLNG